jgi:zinc transporter, ZIP family
VAEAAFWGFAGASSLLIGAVIGVRGHLAPWAVGLILAFGAGTLISSVAFELTDEAYRLGGGDAVAIGLAAGSLAYYAGTVAIARRGGSRRMDSAGRDDEDSSTALLLGAVLDGIPESAVIGITLLGGGEVGVAFLAAVFISNLPESISSSQGMAGQGTPLTTILARWAIVVAASTAAAAAGYGVLDGASGESIALMQAFAGGAVLAMLADTMFPEAFLHIRGDPELRRKRDSRAANPWLVHSIGLLTTFGFSVAYLLSTLD